MKNKVLVFVVAILSFAGLILFLKVQGVSDANAQSLSAASNQEVILSSANDVGASAPWVSRSVKSASDGLTAGGARVIQLPVAGSTTQLNNIWAIERDLGHQSIGWRDAGAGSRDH
jgi:hypothetical protein